MHIQGMMKELNGRTIEHLGFSEIYGIPAFRTVGINLTIGGLGRAIGNRQLAHAAFEPVWTAARITRPFLYDDGQS